MPNKPRIHPRSDSGQKEPAYFARLRTLLTESYELGEVFLEKGLVNAIDVVDRDFLKVMEPYEMKLKHVDRKKLEKGVYVIPPQDHSSIVMIPGVGYEIDELIGPDGIFGIPFITNNDDTITTGDGPGKGDVWYVPRIGLVKDLEAFLVRHR